MDTVEQANKLCKDTMVEHLGIEITLFEKGKVEAKMPVDSRTYQPMRILHGGASAALAESIASIGSAALVDLTKETINGLEINANHVRSVKEGYVYAKAEIIHKGRTTHIWDIKVYDEQNRLVCVSRMTNIVLARK